MHSVNHTCHCQTTQHDRAARHDRNPAARRFYCSRSPSLVDFSAGRLQTLHSAVFPLSLIRSHSSPNSSPGAIPSPPKASPGAMIGRAQRAHPGCVVMMPQRRAPPGTSVQCAREGHWTTYTTQYIPHASRVRDLSLKYGSTWAPTHSHSTSVVIAFVLSLCYFQSPSGLCS